MVSNHGDPELVDIIYNRLHQWRNQQAFPYPTTLSWEARAALREQDFIGWNNLAFGMVGKTLVKMQRVRLKAQEKKTPAHVWVSKLIRKIWDLHKKMWDHRNSFVHKDQTSMHSFEIEAMDRAIRWEFTVGRKELPITFNGFFRGTVERILAKDAIAKCQWLSSIWYARDFYQRQQNLELWNKDTVASTFIQRNTIRKKRKRRLDNIA